MKTQIANAETRALCLRIVPRVGNEIRLTAHPRNLAMSNGRIYLSTSGYEFTGYTAGSSTSPAMIDIEGIAELAGIGVDQINSGQFDNARCYLFACDWNNPIEDYEEIVASIMGRTHLLDQRYKIEEMSLIDALNQSVGRTYMATCQKTFGGQEFAGCKVNLAPLTATALITAVNGAHNFIAAGLPQANDFFTAGTVKFTTGQNAGLKAMEVKIHSVGGLIEVYEPFYYTPMIGDAIEIIAGCRKRKQDCKAHSNIINFGGFPYVPTTTQYTKVGTR